MKIGFDAKRAFLNSAGLGNYSRNTLLSLKKYFPENEYLLFTPEIRIDLFPEQSEFDIHSPDSPSSKIFKSLWRSFSLTRILEKRGLDLFHGLTHELPAGIHKTGVKSIVTIHDLIFMRFPQYYKPVDRKIYLQKIKYACSAANAIIAISKQTSKDLENFLNVNPDKIKVIHQGISERFFLEKKSNFSTLKEKYNLPGQYILSVGTIEKRKNQLNVLKALHQAKIDLPYVLVGKPTSYATGILEYATKNKIEKQVLFLDKVTDDDLPGLYSNAEFMAYISEFEGFGLPIIEAMASGCPVVTSDASCMPETAGDSAVCLNPADFSEIGKAFKKIIEDRNFRSNLIKKGEIHAREFLPQKTALSLMDLYKKVLSNE